MKIVLNKRFGGFAISQACAKHMAANGSAQAAAELAELEGKKKPKWYGYGYVNELMGYERTDPLLVRAVEELGSEAASGDMSKLVVVDIPDGTEYEIENYDGLETVHEKHRSW